MEFRASLVAEMDQLVQDYREQRTTKVETLYQILEIIRQAGISERVERAALEQYTMHIDLIDNQQQLAEQRGAQTTRDRVDGDRQENGTDEHQTTNDERGTQDADKFLWEHRRELVSKRRRKVSSDASSSDEGSSGGHGEGESNKKKRVYQSQLPWY
jgi:hypothetical protein